MEEEEVVGEVFKYFAKPGVAALIMTQGTIKIGDTIRIKGATTDFTQKVESMEIDNVKVEKAEKGQSVGIKVIERVRPSDVVYRV